MSEKIREEVINVTLAEILNNKGLEIVIPESIQKRKKPDIIVDLNGLRLIIEGREESKGKSLSNDVVKKLSEGYGDIGIALLYPNEIYQIQTISELKRNIDKKVFCGAIFYWGKDGINKMSFDSKHIYEIIEIVREVFDLHIKENILKQQVEEVEGAIESIVKDFDTPDLWLSDTELTEKLKSALGIK